MPFRPVWDEKVQVDNPSFPRYGFLLWSQSTRSVSALTALVLCGICCALLLNITIARADALRSDVIDLQQTSNTTRQYLGPVTVTIIGNNPLRDKLAAGQRSVTSSPAPRPVFLQSTGTGTTTTAKQTATRGGLSLPTGYECKTVDTKPPTTITDPATGKQTNNTITPDDALAAWNVYLGHAETAADALIAKMESPNAPYKSDADKVTTFRQLNSQIEADPSYLRAASCLNNLGTLDLSNASSATKTTIQTLTAPTSPYAFMLTPGSPIPTSDYVLVLDPFQCTGLLGGSSTSTQTVTSASRVTTTGNDATTTVSITQKCLGQVAASAGFSFNTARQQTFSAVGIPNNGSASTTATVQAATSSSFQTVPTAYVHWAPSASCQGSENCWWISFGLGVTSAGGSTSNNVNYMLGVTRSFQRYAYLTLGASTAQQTNAAHGYVPGITRVPTGSAIPTVTNGVAALFLGVSFGGSP